MRLLVVEDEAPLRYSLCDALKAEGFAVDSAEDGEIGLFMGLETSYDLLLVDLGLPKLSGIELIKKLREADKHYPMLILTARSDWQDKVEALEAGADDYVVKPFHIQEVVARIHALLRRSMGRSSSLLEYPPLCLDTAGKVASIAGEVMELTSFEYNTLEYLVLKAGQVVSKTELTEHLYDQDFDRDSNVIEVFIGRLRKKIDPSNTLKPIATVRGQGYRFTLKESEKHA